VLVGFYLARSRRLQNPPHWMVFSFAQGFQEAVANVTNHSLAPQFSRTNEPFDALANAEVYMVYLHK